MAYNTAKLQKLARKPSKRVYLAEIGKMSQVKDKLDLSVT